ncbi:MAG: NUDIX hydrolase [Spirochaetia bacterium]|nr:NUDIX hydrolase [Spirochaetia bacterium]
MQFCSTCGKPVVLKIPPGDSLPRHVCEGCGTIHYQNPRLVVGCLPVWNGEILICKRAIEPAYGKWTLPAGFMENGEDLAAGAMRETREEANAEVRIRHLHSVYSIPHIHQVHVFFLADLIDGQFGSGPESLEVKLVNPADIPWREIAFGSVRFALERYLADPTSTCAHIDSFKRL